MDGRIILYGSLPRAHVNRHVKRCWLFCLDQCSDLTLSLVSVSDSCSQSVAARLFTAYRAYLLLVRFSSIASQSAFLLCRYSYAAPGSTHQDHMCVLTTHVYKVRL